MTAWGIVLAEKEIDKHTRYCVHLFLHGLLHPEQGTVRARLARPCQDTVFANAPRTRSTLTQRRRPPIN